VTYEEAIAFQKALEASLAHSGFLIAPTPVTGPTAPLLSVNYDKTIAPDMLVFGSHWQVPCWVDAKLKTSLGYFRTTSSRTTGIEVDVWNRYKRVEDITGIPVFVIFGQREQNEVRMCSIDQAWLPSRGDGVNMRNWDYDALPLLCSLDDIRNRRPIAPCVPIPNVQQALFDVEPKRMGLGYKRTKGEFDGIS
jgi:hypothetical protein